MRRFENHVLSKVAHLASIIIVVLSLDINAAASPTELLKKAQDLLDQNQDNAALACLNTLISKEPNNARAYSERAYAHGKVGKTDKALEDSNKAIALAPKLAIAYAYRAGVYVEMDCLQKALEDSNKAIALEPRLAIAYSIRSAVYERLKKYQKQLEDCNKAIAIDPKDPRNHYFRAMAFRNLKQYQRALRDCNKALSLNSKKATPHMERGRIYSYLGDFYKAIEDYTAAIKIYPLSEAYRLRADAYGKLGQFHKQIDDLTIAIKIEPESAVAYSTAATAYEELGSYDKAVELRTKVLALDPKNPFEWSFRANDYELVGKLDLAQADRKKVKALASPSERLYVQVCNPLIDFNNLSLERPKAKIEKQLQRNPVFLSSSYDSGDHICVPVQVNGHPLRLMLDTGCGHSDLWEQAMPGVAKKDNVKLQGTKANGTKYSHGFFRARDLKLGHLELSNVAMSVNEGLVGHPTLSGFLGGNILENFVVTVDYGKEQVILANSSKQNRSKRAIVVPMILRFHRPCCTVRLDGKLDVMALIDTGCPFSMSADTLLKPVLSRKLAFSEHISGPWLGCLRSEPVRLKSLELGPSSFEAPEFDVFPASEAPDAAAEIILGDDFLRWRFQTVTFDYPARRVIFEPD